MLPLYRPTWAATCAQVACLPCCVRAETTHAWQLLSATTGRQHGSSNVPPLPTSRVLAATTGHRASQLHQPRATNASAPHTDAHTHTHTHTHTRTHAHTHVHAAAHPLGGVDQGIQRSLVGRAGACQSPDGLHCLPGAQLTGLVRQRLRGGGSNAGTWPMWSQGRDTACAVAGARHSLRGRRGATQPARPRHSLRGRGTTCTATGAQHSQCGHRSVACLPNAPPGSQGHPCGLQGLAVPCPPPPSTA